MIVARARNGSTGEHLSRRPAGHARAAGVALPRVRHRRRCVAVTALTARLAYLQIANGTPVRGAVTGQPDGARADHRAARAHLRPHRARRSSRTSRPTRSRSARPTCRTPGATRSSNRLSALLAIDPSEIHATIDGNPGSAFDLVRIAQDVDKATALLISEAGDDLPGVEVTIEARRAVRRRPAPVAAARLHRPGVRRAAARPARRRLPARRPARQGRPRVAYETELRGDVRLRAGRARRDRSPDAGPPDRRPRPFPAPPSSCRSTRRPRRTPRRPSHGR